MHLRSRDLWYEGHATLCTKRRPPLAMPPLLGIANVKLATLSHWQHSQPPALRPIKIKISHKSLIYNADSHALLEVSPQKFLFTDLHPIIQLNRSKSMDPTEMV